MPTPTNPAGHCSVQLGWPARDVNVPCGQGTHADASDEPTFGFARPALQGVHSVEPGLLANEPAAHRKHDAGEMAPVMGLYLPALQLRHCVTNAAPCWSPNVPTGHGSAKPAVQYAPAVHRWHAAAPAPLYVPALQLVQNGAPLVLVNVPSTHVLQPLGEVSSMYVPALHLE